MPKHPEPANNSPQFWIQKLTNEVAETNRLLRSFIRLYGTMANRDPATQVDDGGEVES